MVDYNKAQTKQLPAARNRDQRFLQPEQIEMIEEALRSLGQFGEVRLIVENGRLRFLITQKSFDVFKWQPGSLSDNPD